MAGVRGKGERGQRRLAITSPQASASANSMRQRKSLQRVFHAGAHPHPLIAMPQERTQIPQLARRHPDRREAILGQQFQEQRGVSAVVLLSAGFDFADFRRVTDVAGHGEFLHQPEKPSHRPGRFNAHDNRRRQVRVEVPNGRPLMGQRSLDDLPSHDPTSQPIAGVCADRNL